SSTTPGEEIMSVVARGFAALLGCLAIVAFAKDNASGQFEIRTLSNRADLISGGDALVEVVVPQSAPLQHVRLYLNGRDVTATFRTDVAARVMRGLLTGLVAVPHEFLAYLKGQVHGRPPGSLTITNHRIRG